MSQSGTTAWRPGRWWICQGGRSGFGLREGVMSAHPRPKPDRPKSTHSSRCRDRRAQRGQVDSRPSFRAEAAVDRTTLASDRRIAGAHILAQRTEIVR